MDFLDEVLEKLQEKPKDKQITIFDIINDELLHQVKNYNFISTKSMPNYFIG